MAEAIAVLAFVGQLRPLPESGRPTGIYKSRLEVPMQIGPHGFVDDRQADLRVHGGPEKAIHLYPADHYARLAARFPEQADRLLPGSLGENLSAAGLTENDVRLGDIWQLGEALLQVCQPRNPCWKIDERFGAQRMAGYIAEHLLSGWYWRVVRPGRYTPGDGLLAVDVADEAFSLREAMELWQQHRPDPDALARLAATPGIARQWQDKIKARLQRLRTLSQGEKACPPVTSTTSRPAKASALAASR